MVVPAEDAWDSVESILDQAISAILAALENIKQSVISASHFLWTSTGSFITAALDMTKNGIFIAGHALFTALVVLLSWIAIIYVACLTIYFLCKLFRWHQQRRGRRNERQPLLYNFSRRGSSAHPVSMRRSSTGPRAHRELFRVEIGRRRQDQLRREQTRILEVHHRESRVRRQREMFQQRLGRHVQEHHETVFTWLQTSGLPALPDYGSIAPRAPPRFVDVSEQREPPPPYPLSTGEEPPPYSHCLSGPPPAYH